MHRDVRIAVAVQPLFPRDFLSAEDEPAAGHELVHIVAKAGARQSLHKPSLPDDVLRAAQILRRGELEVDFAAFQQMNAVPGMFHDRRIVRHGNAVPRGGFISCLQLAGEEALRRLHRAQLRPVERAHDAAVFFNLNGIGHGRADHSAAAVLGLPDAAGDQLPRDQRARAVVNQRDARLFRQRIQTVFHGFLPGRAARHDGADLFKPAQRRAHLLRFVCGSDHHHAVDFVRLAEGAHGMADHRLSAQGQQHLVDRRAHAHAAPRRDHHGIISRAHYGIAR